MVYLYVWDDDNTGCYQYYQAQDAPTDHDRMLVIAGAGYVFRVEDDTIEEGVPLDTGWRWELVPKATIKESNIPGLEGYHE